MKYRRGPATCQFSSQDVSSQDDETTRRRLLERFGMPLSKSPTLQINQQITKSRDQQMTPPPVI